MNEELASLDNDTREFYWSQIQPFELDQDESPYDEYGYDHPWEF